LCYNTASLDRLYILLVKNTLPTTLSITAGLVIASAFFVIALPAQAENFRSPEVRVFQMTKKGTTETQQDSFNAFDADSENGATVAVGDVNADGIDEIVVGAGHGSEPYVRVYNAAGIRLAEFLAYDVNMTAGVNVAVGNLGGGKAEEIVTGTGKGGGPQVRVFDMNGNIKFTPGFFAYDEGFRGGVQVTTANINGKGRDEIVTAAGPGGGPHVRAFNKRGVYTGFDLFPYSSDFRGGVSIASANVDGGAEDEIIVGQYNFGQQVKVYKTSADRRILGEFNPYADGFAGGVVVAGVDVDRDGFDEVVTIPRQGGSSHLRSFEGHGAIVDSGFLAYEDSFRGGSSVAGGNVDSDKRPEIVVVPQKPSAEGRLDKYKYIEVDLSEQRLRAYRNGVKEIEFLVSTGTSGHTTPAGEYSIRRKIPLMDFVSLDQDNASADYYETLENVHYNMEFLPHFYLHEAYWHNNFGHPMSHGCVNISLSNAALIYNWSNTGDTVIIQP